MRAAFMTDVNAVEVRDDAREPVLTRVELS